MSRGVTQIEGTVNVVPRSVLAVFNTPAGASATDYDGLFFIADAPYEIVEVIERHAVAGSDTGSVTLMVKKVPSGTAKASGVDVLATGLDLKATANTNQRGTLHSTVANRRLDAGDALGVVPTGTLTGVDGVTVMVRLQRI